MERLKNTLVILGILGTLSTFWGSVVTIAVNWETLMVVLEAARVPDEGGLNGLEKFEILWEDYLGRNTQ